MSTTNAHKNVFEHTFCISLSPCMAQKLGIAAKATMNSPRIAIRPGVCRLVDETHIFAIDNQHIQISQTALNHTIPLIINFHDHECTCVSHNVNGYFGP